MSTDPSCNICEACGSNFDPSINGRFCCIACSNIPGYGEMMRQLTRQGMREREKLELVIFGHYQELFPNYAWSDFWSAVDLMAAEIKALRFENGDVRNRKQKL